MKQLKSNPSWESVISICLEVIANPLAESTAKQHCKDQILKLAKIVDAEIAEIEAYENSTTTLGDLIEEDRKKGVYL